MWCPFTVLMYYLLSCRGELATWACRVLLTAARPHSQCIGLSPVPVTAGAKAVTWICFQDEVPHHWEVLPEHIYHCSSSIQDATVGAVVGWQVQRLLGHAHECCCSNPTRILYGCTHMTSLTTQNPKGPSTQAPKRHNADCC